jgi:hypothetical protein
MPRRGFCGRTYIQHNPQVPTGLRGFMDAFRARFAQKLPSDYKRQDGQHHPSAWVRYVPRPGRQDSRTLGRRLIEARHGFMPRCDAQKRAGSIAARFACSRTKRKTPVASASVA